MYIKYEEMKQLIKNDNKESKCFCKQIFNIYPKMSLKINFNNDITQLLEWYFAINESIYIKQFIVKTYKKLSDFTFKNQHYAKINIYKNTTNIEYYSIIFSTKYKKDYLTIEEVYEDLNNSYINNLLILPKNSLNRTSGKTFQTKFQTESNFCSNYVKNGKEYCQASFYYNVSNIDICSITLSGNDDYSISKDYFSYKEAEKEWNKLKKQIFVNIEDLTGSYFSN